MTTIFTRQAHFLKFQMQIKRENVNILVKNVYQTIKSIKSNVIFGISPAGNIQNCMSIGADVETWLSQDGYVDLYYAPDLLDEPIWEYRERNNVYKPSG